MTIGFKIATAWLADCAPTTTVTEQDLEVLGRRIDVAVLGRRVEPQFSTSLEHAPFTVRRSDIYAPPMPGSIDTAVIP